MKKTKDLVRIIQLSNYVQPEIKEIAGRDYVTYGVKNSYFYYLIDRSRGSATNGAVIQSLCDIIFGAGTNSDALNEMISEDEQKRVVNDLYSLGQAAIQVQYFGGRKSAKGTHLPVETLAPEKVDEDNIIKAYYYAKDWNKVRSKKDLTRIPVFGTSNEGIEVIYIKSYSPGSFYFKPVTFQGGLQWAEMEEEIANYHVNAIKSGLAPSMFIAMNNGIPTEEKADEIEKRIVDKHTGSSNAGKIVLVFSDGKETEPTVTPIPLSRAAEQYQFLSDESARKILTSHRVVSPLLVGLNSATGFSSNADEIMVGFTALEHFVARPFRMLLIEQGFDPLMEFNGKKEELEFETINPFLVEVQEKAEEVIEEIVEETEEELSKEWVFSENAADELIELGTDINLDDWELIDERDVDYENEIYLDWELKELNEQDEKSLLKKILEFVRTGTPRAGTKSSQDKKVKDNYYMVRYVYFPNRTGTGKTGESREFCKAMVRANKLYRKEDIIKMDNSVVNKGWGLGGADKYSIWKYKGGGACHHRWRRKTFVAKKKTNVRGKDAKPIGTRAAEIRGYTVKNPWQVSVRPIDMPKKGFINK